MKMNGLSKKKKELPAGLWRALAVALPMSLIAPVASYIGIKIMTNTGIWWIPLLIGYLTLLQIPLAFWIDNREKDVYHAQVGHEIYYKENQAALRRALRKARRAGIPDDIRRTLEYYRSRSDTFRATEMSEQHDMKKRRKAVILYAGAVITALLGIYLINKAFPIPQGLFDQKVKKADYTSIFLLAGGLLMLVSAGGLMLKKKVWPVRYSAAIVLALGIWSSYLAYTLRKRPSTEDCLIQAACLGVFVLAAFVIPAIAGDVRTAEQVWREKKELKLSLFELGHIGEDELKLFS